MRTRAARVGVAFVLLCSAGGAVALVWDVERRAPSQAPATLAARIDPLLETVADVALAQTGYLAPGGRAPEWWLDRFPERLRDLSAATAELSAVLQSEGAARELQAFADATAQLAQADARVRDHLVLGDVSSASDVVFGEAREALAAMRVSLAAARTAELSTLATARDAAVQRAQLGLAAIALVWVAGVLVLVRVPRDRQHAAWAAEPPRPPEAFSQASVNLADAADLCGEIARVGTTDGLAALLKRMAGLLDAVGVIIWVGAGEELFPVIAQGYEAAVVRRIGAISLRSDNATAAAWRAQTLQAVHGDATSQSALVAPVCGPEGCVGVLAVELRRGREDDPVIRAVVTLIAAQLASLVTGWPGARVAEVRTGAANPVRG